MGKVLKLVLIAVTVAMMSYAASGYISAAAQAGALKLRAKALIDIGKGPDAIRKDRLYLLLRVQDPAFFNHKGIDVKTAGAGLTTVTQSLSKRLAFNNFKPGVGKIRQTTYAIALEKHLTKDEILALFLETVPMGNGPNGWENGLFRASESFYGIRPNDLDDTQFIELIAVMIAPSSLNYKTRSKTFIERVERIERLHKGECQLEHFTDVWLKACAPK